MRIAPGSFEGLDAFNEQALGVLTSSKLLKALDISKEDPKIVERYGKGSPNNKDDGGPRLTTNFLIARRLIEAGVRCVTLGFSAAGTGTARTSSRPAKRCRCSTRPWRRWSKTCDRADMLDDVSVVVWGEFGRTPKINSDAGRDHWPQVSCALLAGGGMRTGQVIGSTNRLGEHAKDRPVHFQEVLRHALQVPGHRRGPHHARGPRRPAAVLAGSQQVRGDERAGGLTVILSAAKNLIRVGAR